MKSTKKSISEMPKRASTPNASLLPQRHLCAYTQGKAALSCSAAQQTPGMCSAERKQQETDQK